MDINRNHKKSNWFISVENTKNCLYDYKMAQNVSSEKVYEIMQVKPLRQEIKLCQIKYFGHLIRLPTR